VLLPSAELDQLAPLFVNCTLAVLPGAITVAVQVVGPCSYAIGLGEHDSEALGVALLIVTLCVTFAAAE
jgi:hypothetical protein